MKKIVLLLAVLLGIVSLRAIYAQSVVSANPVIWKTPYTEFSSSNFYIQIGETRFLGSGNIRVRSDPGLDRQTLELEWPENGINMRLFFYFKKTENGMWEMYDLLSYNKSGNDWIYFQNTDTNGNPVRSLLGQRDFSSERIFMSKDGNASIYCKDCSITAFIKNLIPSSAYGYSIDFRIGIPQGETITISNDPMSGYGVNTLLLDSSGTLVKDQSDFQYFWRSENDQILTVQSISVPYPDGSCAYGVLPPCPNFNVQISGENPGVTRVILDVQRLSDNTIIASNAFSVKVLDMNQPPCLMRDPGDFNCDDLINETDLIIFLKNWKI